MSRLIKFRAWRPSNVMTTKPEMLTWEQLAAHVNVDWLLRNTDTGYVLMQYTGLKDKNGVEVYEGDVVENLYDGTMSNRHLVTFDAEGKGDADGDFFSYGYFFADQIDDFEVIGNIHENPELLS